MEKLETQSKIQTVQNRKFKNETQQEFALTEHDFQSGYQYFEKYDSFIKFFMIIL